jgi:hypothetical protein
METQLIRSSKRNADRWTALPFVAWGAILAALVWQLGTTNQILATGIIAVTALIQAGAVAMCWSGAVSGSSRRLLMAILILPVAAISYLAVDNTAGLDGAAVWPLFAGLLFGLMLQLRLVSRSPSA